ncbi:MAG: thiamine-phosphate kinase [Bacteroidales bacterium]|nr:thiamine-phosphate kinase [Bacteroidales bacterium]
MDTQNFTDIGRIEAVRQLFEGTAYAPFASGSFEAKGPVRSAARVFIEGPDFNLVYFPLKHLGYKCVTAVTGELYAALARPRLLSVTLGISAKLDFAQIRTLWEGVVSAAKEHGYESLSLELIPSPNGLTVSLSATGDTTRLTAARRPAPKSKDLLCVSGPLGAAYLGMRVLERGANTFAKTGQQPDLSKHKLLVGAFLKPEISPRTVSRLEEEEIYPSAGYLVSRGLADAVLRLVRDTGLGAKVYADKIPFEGNSFALGRELDIDPVSAAMNGGDDYRLLFTVPILSLEKFRREFQTFDIIGHLALPEVGAVLVTPDGVELPMKAQGWPEEE